MNARPFIGAVLLALALVPGAGGARADRGGFEITRFDVQVQVLENSDILVTERIEVLFHQPRRGIYREIPVRYTDPTGYQYGYGFKLLGVDDDQGRPRRVKQTGSGAMVRLRIGDPDRQVRGTEVYVVRYRARDVLRQFGDRDELYWNVTGHQWDADIGAASVMVEVPGGAEAPDLQVKGWAGGYGSRVGDVQARVASPGRVTASSEVALGPREGLTVVVSWPQGAVSFPGPWIRTWRLVTRNLIVVVPFIALYFLFRRYRRHGVDPTIQAAVMVRYEPPPGVSPGTIGTLVDERVDLADITATIVDLAVRGFFTIETEVRDELFGLVSRKETSFVRNTDAYEGELLLHERLVLDALFEADPLRVTTADLKEEFYKAIPGIRTALYDRLVEKDFASGNPETVRRRTVGLGLTVAVLTGVSGMLLARVQGGVFPNAAILPVASGIVTFVLFLAFAPAMPRRTRAGVTAVGWARGFEEFAGRVEGDRMERDAARDTFESLLPYAMALGVATKWSRRFEGIYAEQAPRWYVGPMSGMHGFSTVAFHDSLQSAMAETGKSLAATPRSSGSSGSGGGGFSGGGGGGGGGGSW